MEIDFQFGKCFICHDDSGASQACFSCMRKLSLGEETKPLPVKPKSYINDTDMQCGYCNTITSFIHGNIDFGIRYCFSHRDIAERDMKNWLISKNLVSIVDFKAEYPDLYRILVNGIKLRRSDNRIDSNWKIDNTKLIHKHPKFGWTLSFYKYEPSTEYNSVGSKITKNIPILNFLNDDAYGLFFKNMIENLHNRLENGFYNQ